MMSLESLFPEEWVLSNVLSTGDLYGDELQGNHSTGGGGGVGELVWKADVHDQFNDLTDSGIGKDLESLGITWLDEEVTCITNLDASLQTSSLPDPDDPVADVLADLVESIDPDMETPIVSSFEEQAQYLVSDNKATVDESSLIETPAPSSPIETSSIEPRIKYVQPSSIDTRALTSHAQIVMSDLNVLHLPEPQDDQAGLMLLEALTDPSVAVELSYDEVESLLSSPPSSPEAIVPTSAPDNDYMPSRKRKATSGGSSRSLKCLKPSERKERKKVQNKNAATKYRMKKRGEDELTKSELVQLESKNLNLKRQVEDLSSEINYMKGLLNEVLKGKGLKIK